MKLASLKGGRDGRLVVVSRDLTRAALAEDIAPTLQAALDDWGAAAPKLQALAGAARGGRRQQPFAFASRDCASPLPRAYQWADGSAYVNHVVLVRKARGAEMPETFLDRSADVSGRLRRLSRTARRRSRCSMKSTMGSISKRRSPSSPMMCRWASTPQEARRAHHARHARQRHHPARAACRANSRRASASFSQSRLPPFRRSPSRPTNSGRMGRRKAVAAAAVLRQWRAARPSGRRRRHDLRFRAISSLMRRARARCRPARSSAPARFRIGAPMAVRAAGRAGRPRLLLHRRAARRSRSFSKASRARPS